MKKSMYRQRNNKIKREKRSSGNKVSRSSRERDSDESVFEYMVNYWLLFKGNGEADR